MRTAFCLWFLLGALACKQKVDDQTQPISEQQCRKRHDGSFWNGSSCTLPSSNTQTEFSCKQDPYSRWDGLKRACIRPKSDTDCQRLDSNLVFDGKSCDLASNPPNFYRLCMTANLKADVKKTIDAMRSPYLNSTCATVYQLLLMSKNLNLNSSGLTNLAPISSLTHLVTLELRNNLIKDPAEISKLINLEKLDVGKNLLTDASAFVALAKLRWLNIGENQIKSAAPLEAMNLDYLDVSSNHISDLTGLKNKKFALGFYYQNNP